MANIIRVKFTLFLRHPKEDFHGTVQGYSIRDAEVTSLFLVSNNERMERSYKSSTLI